MSSTWGYVALGVGAAAVLYANYLLSEGRKLLKDAGELLAEGKKHFERGEKLRQEAEDILTQSQEFTVLPRD